MKKGICRDFRYFGANYPDATCIEGILYDLDYCVENGDLYDNGLHMPCPFCNSEKLFRDYCCGDVEWYNEIIDEINRNNPEFKLERR